ncbi:hypothetical protein ACLOJK_035164, partial [Asimina triloba]
MGHHSSGTEHFLPELIWPSNLPKLAVFVSIISKAWISRSRLFIDAAHAHLLPKEHHAHARRLHAHARRRHAHAHAHARRCHRLAHAHARRCHRLARADCRVVDHASASTASAIACPLPDAPCRFIATICLLPAPSINGHDCTILVGSSLANMQ